MIDKEIFEEFTRARRRNGRLAIQILWITWPHPHAPKSRWLTITNLPEDADQAAVEKERATASQDSRYFSVCEECGERNPVGWMDNVQLCQSCAEKNHGVVY